MLWSKILIRQALPIDYKSVVPKFFVVYEVAKPRVDLRNFGTTIMFMCTCMCMCMYVCIYVIMYN